MFSKVIDYTVSVSIPHIISCTLLELDAIQGELSSIAMYIAWISFRNSVLVDVHTSVPVQDSPFDLKMPPIVS